jgi:hypothetical protein
LGSCLIDFFDGGKLLSLARKQANKVGYRFAW